MADAEVRIARRVLRQQSNSAELPLIASGIGHPVFYDQMMFRVDRGLNVAAERYGSFAITGHRTGIRVGKSEPEPDVQPKFRGWNERRKVRQISKMLNRSAHGVLDAVIRPDHECARHSKRGK